MGVRRKSAGERGRSPMTFPILRSAKVTAHSLVMLLDRSNQNDR